MLVHQGQVLAEIDSPETLKALDQAKAAVDQAKAQVAQADARVTTAEADKEAAVAAITKAQAGILRFTGAREYREKQFNRITALHQSDSVEKRLVDEQEANCNPPARPKMERSPKSPTPRHWPTRPKRGSRRLKPTLLPRGQTWKSPKRPWKRPTHLSNT